MIDAKQAKAIADKVNRTSDLDSELGWLFGDIQDAANRGFRSVTYNWPEEGYEILTGPKHYEIKLYLEALGYSVYTYQYGAVQPICVDFSKPSA